MIELTYLGHAGFLLETAATILVIDPWLSPAGAFDAGWFQLPRNHHLATPLLERLATTGKRLLVYVTHHHKDHFDPAFLRRLPAAKATLLLPRFEKDPFLRHRPDLARLHPVSLGDGECYDFDGGSLRVYLDDSGINRDSAVLVRAGGWTFLDMNDAKVHERLAEVKRDAGEVDVLACQYSGATWHPICYHYGPDRRAAIARRKARSKFEAVARTLEALTPRLFLPSAGPACFLDPELFHLNFEQPTTFPLVPELAAFLEQRLPHGPAPLELQPGDRVCARDPAPAVDARRELVVHRGASPWGGERGSLRGYLEAYQADYTGHFQDLKAPLPAAGLAAVFAELRSELARKLAVFEVHGAPPMPLYFGLAELPDAWLRVGFKERSLTVTPRVDDQSFYSIQAPAWQLRRVLQRQLSWEDYYLTFRAKLRRVPDVYNTLINGFIWLEVEELGWFCGKLRELRGRNERMLVEWGGRCFAVDRYCPHQGADLKAGYVTPDGHLVCPRHRWRFDLAAGGVCSETQASIGALPMAAEEARGHSTLCGKLPSDLPSPKNAELRGAALPG